MHLCVQHVCASMCVRTSEVSVNRPPPSAVLLCCIFAAVHQGWAHLEVGFISKAPWSGYSNHLRHSEAWGQSQRGAGAIKPQYTTNPGTFSTKSKIEAIYFLNWMINKCDVINVKSNSEQISLRSVPLFVCFINGGCFLFYSGIIKIQLPGNRKWVNLPILPCLTPLFNRPKHTLIPGVNPKWTYNKTD